VHAEVIRELQQEPPVRGECHLAETPLDVREIGFLDVSAKRRDPAPWWTDAVLALEPHVDDPRPSHGLGLAGDLLGRESAPLAPKAMELELVDPAVTALEDAHGCLIAGDLKTLRAPPTPRRADR